MSTLDLPIGHESDQPIFNVDLNPFDQDKDNDPNLPQNEPDASMLAANYPPYLVCLRNIKNSCYLNSIVQCLTRIDAFRDFLIEKYVRTFQSTPNRTNLFLIVSSII